MSIKVAWTVDLLYNESATNRINGVWPWAYNSDVKRGQNLEAETEAKDKNKKYQMLADNIQANLYHYDQHDTVYFSFSLAQ